MRYTTLIDISEYRQYQNINMRLVYLHLVLKAGYHDKDRDVAAVSIRQLAASVGITVAATRHALQQLETLQLVRREGDKLRVTKWVAQETITSRPKAKLKAADKESLNAVAQQYETEQRQYEERLEEALRSLDNEQLEQWAKELEDNTSRKHCGLYIKACQENADYVRSFKKRNK